MIGRRGEATATVESQSLSFTMISEVFNSAHPSHTYPTISPLEFVFALRNLG